MNGDHLQNNVNPKTTIKGLKKSMDKEKEKLLINNMPTQYSQFLVSKIIES